MEFSAPSDEQIQSLLKSSLKPLRASRLNWSVVVPKARGLSQSEIVRAAEDAVKTAILDERNTLTTGDIVERLDERAQMREAFSTTTK